jgi:hypothetical protein
MRKPMEAERRARRSLLALLLAAILAACAGTGGAPVEQPPAAAEGAPAAPEGFPSARYESVRERDGRVYRIANEESQIDVYVYRGGRLARLGHNHIVTSRALNGFVLDAKDPSRSQLDFYFPVDSLSVDEPELRAAAGDAFASQPSEGDIAGTRRNLLGERMLNAEQFPFILVSGQWRGGTESAPELGLTITVRGIAHEKSATAQIERDGDILRASGEVRLSHAELGLEPFTVLGGAIAVEDGFDVRYRIVARAAGGPAMAR